jgi:hypothetical protein
MSAAENPIFNSAATSRTDRLLPEQTEQMLPTVVAGWAWWMGKTEEEIKDLFSLVYQRSSEASELLISEIRERSQRVREERPMTLLGVIAGSAFAAGIGAAIWKSRRS